MNRRPTEPAGKPFLRVRLDGAPQNRPYTKPTSKPAPKPNKPSMTAEDLQKGAIERGNREQARESIMPKRAKGGAVMKKATKFGKAMTKKSADTMGRAMKKYAKGGKIDGCATKGKTKGKMVKMAMGGMTGLDRAGAMSGRTMPTPGMGMRPELTRGGPAMMDVGRPDGYKKGGKTKKMARGGMGKGCK